MSRIQEAKEALGELFIVGLMGNGKDLSPDTARFLKDARIGGVLLFKDNFENAAQVARLITGIQNCRADLPLWVSVDQEGGRVQRFKGTGSPGEFLPIPVAAKIGEKGSTDLARRISCETARELRSVGANVNFTPVADILTNPENPVIGDRAFGTDAETVSQFACAVVEGHLEMGVEPCVKHFPGHGDTDLDSHFALPRVDTDLATLRAREWKPFRDAFAAGCKWVMTAHVLMPAIDAEKPATLSRRAITDVLRGELGFDGLIVSDDLQMHAVTEHYGADVAPRMALQAGCDLLIYRTETVARLAWESLTQDLENGRLDPELVLVAAERSRSLKRARHAGDPARFHGEIKDLGSAERAALYRMV